MRKMVLAACATALCSLAAAAAPANAQLIKIQPDAPDLGLTENQVRVLQFALRDIGCYEGPRSGKVTAATRTALRCAREKTSSDGPEQLARQLNLYDASFLAPVDGRDTGSP